LGWQASGKYWKRGHTFKTDNKKKGNLYSKHTIIPLDKLELLSMLDIQLFLNFWQKMLGPVRRTRIHDKKSCLGSQKYREEQIRTCRYCCYEQKCNCHEAFILWYLRDLSVKIMTKPQELLCTSCESSEFNIMVHCNVGLVQRRYRFIWASGLFFWLHLYLKKVGWEMVLLDVEDLVECNTVITIE